MTINLSEVGKAIQDESGIYNGGPASDFESVGRLTLQTLLANGLLPSHRVLDFGCGSLRNGYWLIRFLDSGNYFGIEPVEKGVKAGLKHLIDPELEAFKKPRFLYNKDSDISAFELPFDFVVARSILTHTCPGMLRRMFDTFAKSSPNGTMLASYWRYDLPKALVPWSENNRYRNLAVTGENLDSNRVFALGDELADDDMRFVAIVRYSLSHVQKIAADYGLIVEEDWSFPPINRQIWLRIKRA
jgi:SAM-dependent methyltransferase